ncbi:Thiosulfate sulfurtransferase [Thalictrum thalictroides]|uniref:Thiosulfate sulfurtransferase n=1 Tax=Thalictrum thalictroides TaxID=46969 RepID=A0A7J6VLA1_THATH|nr:Thiosulfate sulfurtransferase [Thalictrum thalictroides]
MEAKKSSSGAVETIDVHQAKDLIYDSGYTYIDVRTTEEFNKGHVDVKNILNIPYMFSTPEGRVINPRFLEQVISACSKEDKLIVGCQSGVRSLHASVVLLEAEFKHIKNMGGGYAAWVENGLPVKKTKSEL